MKLNKYIEIDGIRYKINPDYKNIIEIDTIFKDNQLTDEEKVYKSLEKFYLFFYSYPQEIHEQLAMKMVEFYMVKQNKGKSKGTKSTVKLFDYELDWDLIYSAFYECYNIRLIGYMHWHEFKQLFDNLNPECKFCKVQSYRGYKGNDKEQKKLREYWKLPVNKIDEKRYEDLYEKLK